MKSVGATPLRLTGVNARFEALQTQLGQAEDARAAQGAVRRLHETVEGALAGAGRFTLAPTHAALRGWLAYFAEPHALECHFAARRTLTETLQARRVLRQPFTVQIRPLRGLMAVRGNVRHALVQFPSPVVALAADGLGHCADLVQRRPGARARLLESLLAPDCEAVRLRIEELGGAATLRSGRHHDLEAAFDRINADYFGGALDRPRITWSARASRRKLGHYDLLHDTVVLSAVLDSPDVPACAVEFILYHELLHKRFGAETGSGQVRVHTPEFRREERRFRQRAEAEAGLEALLRPRRPGR